MTGVSPQRAASMLSHDSPRVLYVTYDGLLEPLGESQVVSYLTRLVADHRITILSFEKSADLANLARLTGVAERLSACGISWIRLRYHKRPPVLSTAFDVFRGIRRARRACRHSNVAVVHARGYVPALIAMGARSASRAKFLFDMRGLWVDEKTEAGHWRAGGLLYRVGKSWERRFLRSADAIVSLTAAGVRALPSLGYQAREGVPVVVIPTCVDLQRFRPTPKDPELVATLGLANGPVIGCVGTMTNWYMRDEMLRYLACLSRTLPALRVLLVTREDHGALRRDAEAAGVPRSALVITRAAFDAMPRYTALFDAGLFFIRPVPSKRGSAATKLAEFLGCGVPVIINDGVGDSGAIVDENRVGIVLPALDKPAFDQSLAEVKVVLADEGLSARCRLAAERFFDVNKGVERYRNLYRHLSGEPPRR